MGSAMELKGGKNRINRILSWWGKAPLIQLFVAILCFFFSRAGFFEVVRPFSLALYSAAGFSGPAGILAFISMTAGNAIYSGFYETVRQCSAVLIFELAVRYLRINSKRITPLSRAVIMTASAAGTGLVKGLILGLHVYDLITALLTGAFVFSVSILAYPALAASDEARTQRRSNGGRITAAKALLACVSVISLEGLAIANIELSFVLAGILVLVFARRNGSAYGACAGVCIGFVLTLYRMPDSIELPGLFALAGAVSGIRIKYKTVSVFLWTVVVMFFMGLSILGGSLFTEYYSILVSGALFLFIPPKMLESLSEYLVGQEQQSRAPDDTSAKRAALESADRLYVLGKALARVSRSVGEFIDFDAEEEQTVAESVIEIVADRVCRRCNSAGKCWGTNLVKTYKLVEKAVSDLKTDETGLLEIPGWFRSACARYDRFVENLGVAFSIYKVEKIWRQRLGDARERIAEQAGIISGSIMNIARSITEHGARNYGMEESFLEAASGLGLQVADIRAGEGGGTKSSFDVVCEGVHKINLDALDKTVRGCLGDQLVRMGEMRRDMFGYSVLRYMNKPRFKTITGVARLSREQSPVSGDSFTFFITGDGLHISAVCDGAGSGNKAERYSKNTIQMLEYLIEDGIDAEFAVRLIKIYLGIRGENEPLATLDVCAVNLLDGQIRFFKYGASMSYIRSKSGVVEISETGIARENGNSEEIPSLRAEEGDFIILASDGVYEAFCEDGQTSVLPKFIAEIETVNPQQIADMIMTEATLRGGGSRDDMTVLVTRLW